MPRNVIDYDHDYDNDNEGPGTEPRRVPAADRRLSRVTGHKEAQDSQDRKHLPDRGHRRTREATRSGRMWALSRLRAQPSARHAERRISPGQPPRAGPRQSDYGGGPPAGIGSRGPACAPASARQDRLARTLALQDSTPIENPPREPTRTPPVPLVFRAVTGQPGQAAGNRVRAREIAIPTPMVRAG